MVAALAQSVQSARVAGDDTCGLPYLMTVDETAEFLRIGLTACYTGVQAGKIPAQKVGRQWRVYRPVLLEWLATGRISR